MNNYDTYIVVHGASNFSYTKDCIKSFSKYKNVIWSDFEGVSEEIENCLKEHNIEFVESPWPEEQGMSKVNWQKQGFLAGLRRAKELGAKYVFKTRTDLDIVNLDRLFEWLEKGQKISEVEPKLWVFCWDELCNGPCDFNMWGEIDEMEFYWSFPDINKPSERYILPQYFERKDLPYHFTFESMESHVWSWINLADYFGIVVNWFKDLNESPLTEHYANRCIYK